jgi:hypothetical protein
MNANVVKSLADIRLLLDAAQSEAEKATIIEANVATAKRLDDSQARTDLLLGLRELASTIQTQCDTSTTSEPREASGMDALAKTYLHNAITSLTRVPSPKLKSDFRATLNHWRSLLIMALKTADEPAAFNNTIMAVVETEGSFDALRMIRNVSQQLLWQAAIDIQRDRRNQGDIGDPSTFNDGEPDHMDADTELAPTEDEAIDSYTEAHAWLSNVADLLAVDEDDRVRLGLESGLEYTQVKQDDEWIRVYDLYDAIEAQIEKNTQAMRRREAGRVLARRDAFAALARLAA